MMNDLDYTDQKTMGKNIGDDLADGKATMPLLYALEKGTPAQQIQIREALKQASLDTLPDILDTLKKTKAIEYTKQLAEKEVSIAISALDILPDSIYKKALEELAQYATARTF